MGWTVLGSNPGGERDFPHLSRPALGPPSLLYNGYRVFPGSKERPGPDADPSLPSSAVGHERLQLYLYSPYGPYWASVPVQGCTLPLPFSQAMISTNKGTKTRKFAIAVQISSLTNIALDMVSPQKSCMLLCCSFSPYTNIWYTFHSLWILSLYRVTVAQILS